MITIFKKIIAFLVILFFLCGCSAKMPTEKATSSSYRSLNNKCIGWGFRKTPEGPEFTEGQKQLMEKYGCIYRGRSDKKYLYLTFDEGYENGYTSVILDVLKEKGVPAAFFVTGPYVKNEPELILRMANEGHIIGNHTVNHPSMPSLSDKEKISSELYELDRLIYAVCRKKCKYFRPPKGEYSERTLSYVKDLGYINTFWSLAYVDWKNDVSAAEAEKAVLSQLHNGSVLLLHAVSKGNADALGNIIEKAQKDGYTFKSLDEYEA